MKEVEYYLFKDIFFSGEYIIIDKKKLIINFINRFSMIQNLIKDFDNDNIQIVKDKEADINLTYFYKEDIKDDGYKIVISNKCISIFSATERGLFFAQSALKKLIKYKTNKFIIPICTILDEPDFKLRGIIEGFYGEPWTFVKRKKAIDFIIENKMNTYMYAPKDDFYHRKKWREPYPKDILNEIKMLKEYSDIRFVDFYYCISPGNDIDITKASDLEALLEKLNTMIEIGIKDFALLLDDIDYTLKENHKTFYRRTGLVHADLCNKVFNFLSNRIIDFNLIICPSEYWQNYTTLYRKDLNERLDSNIKVFWTGYNTIAKMITSEDCSIVDKSLNKEIILWDNIPVNDVDNKNLFLSPVLNRSSYIKEYNHTGIVLNPMPQFECSKISMICYSHFMWNSQRYNPYYSQRLAANILDSNHAETLISFSNYNGNNRIFDYYDYNLKSLVESKDIKGFNQYFTKLNNVVLEFENINYKELIEELEPWLERAKYDIDIYNKILEANSNNICLDFKSIYEEMVKKEYVIGINLIVKIIEKFIE